MNSLLARYLLGCFLALGLALPVPAEDAGAEDASEDATAEEETATSEAAADNSTFWFNLDEGMWRAELSLGVGIHSGSRSREGDTLYTGTVEYEVPVHAHGTLGLRLLPLLVYDGPDTVWGAGVGLSARLYKDANSYEGLYVEGFGHALFHENRFVGNSSNFNFLIGGGLGYQFDEHWNATLRYDHISNGGIGDRNSGVNTVGLALGYRF